MKFEIKLSTIKEYLRRLTISVQSISSRVEFTGVLITAFDNSITFEGRNDYMDTKIEETSLIDIKIIEPGRVLIKANMLNEIIQKMNGDTVTFNKIDSNVVSIESQDSNYQMNLLTDENYERAIFQEFENVITIKPSDFNKAVSKVIFAGNEYHPKFIFQGLNLIINNGVMTTTVCDGIRVASHKVNVNSDTNINKIIPLKVVKELIKILPTNKEFKFSFNENKGVVVSGNMINQFQLIEGTFPIFNKYFDKNGYTKELTINKSDFEHAIERATILILNKADTSNRIGLTLDSNNFVIESREVELGSSKIELKSFDYNGEAINISLSPKLLADGLKNSETEIIKLYLIEKTSGILIISESDNLTYLLSPMS